MSEIPGIQIANVSQVGLPVQVVAVKWPGHWIIRGIFTFTNLEEVVRRVRPYVASAPQGDLIWTQHCYRLPSYIAYGTGDIPRYGWPTGIYLFGHTGTDCYRQDPVRLDTE